jgi:hypothetical protein
VAQQVGEVLREPRIIHRQRRPHPQGLAILREGKDDYDNDKNEDNGCEYTVVPRPVDPLSSLFYRHPLLAHCNPNAGLD